MCIHVANAVRMADVAAVEVLTPPPPVDYLAWAEANIVFTKRESPFPGPYNRAAFPYFDEVFRALGPDDPCRIVTLAASAQIGKTACANIFVGGSMQMDPGDILYVHPTEPNAERWSKMKLMPLLMGCSALKAVFPTTSKDPGNAVLYKERRDGRGAIQISGANSPASLSQVTMQRQVQDDLAKWEMNSAGDPETQADSRSRAHAFAKIFKISTPLLAPGCRITRNFDAGSQERPYVPCPHCGAFQVLTWDNMLADLDESRPEDAHFTCAECGCEIHEHDRPGMLANLDWRAARPDAAREHRSFWIWSAYSKLQSFEQIAREWLSAKGDPASEQVFLNDACGLAYRALGESVPWETLRDRASESDYARAQIPGGALVLTIGVDCQVDRVEWQLIGWGRDLRRWVIEYGVFPGHVSEAACIAALDGLLKQTWPNGAGQRIAADMLAIDGNAWTEDVWEFARRHPAGRVMMVRGVGQDTAPLLARVKKERNTRTGKLLRWSRRFFNFGTSVLKMALYRNLAKTDPLERGFIGLPKGLDDEFYRQLTAEKRQATKHKKTGFDVWRWVKDPKQDNEGLDTHLQAEAAAIKLGVRSQPDSFWDRLAAERECPPSAASGQLDFEDLPLMRAAPKPDPAAWSPGHVQQPEAAPSAPPPSSSRARSIARRLA